MYRYSLFDAGAHRVDVRNPQEIVGKEIPGALNIPLDELRGRLAELPEVSLFLAAKWVCAVI